MLSTYGLLEVGNLANAHPRRVSAVSGALTTVAANADVWALQNASSTKRLAVSRLRAKFVTTTAFGTGQALLFGFYRVSGFSAIHTGGTGIKTISVTGRDSRLDDAPRALSDVNCRMAAAAAITTATYTAPDADEPFAVLHCPLSTTPAGEMILDAPRDLFPDDLRQNEGVICRPLITMGATGVGTLFVAAEFTHL